MNSQRCIWMIPSAKSPLSQSSKKAGEPTLIFYRKFPTVEKQLSIVNKEYIPLPDRSALANSTLECLGCGKPDFQFSTPRDSCSFIHDNPVYSLTSKHGELWPVLILEQNDVFYCCAPALPEDCNRETPLHKVLSISTGFTLLTVMGEFLGRLPPSLEEALPRLGDLYTLICQAAPFGTLLDADPISIRAAVNPASNPSTIDSTKSPAWRPTQHRGKASLSLLIQESVRAVQYSRPGVMNDWQVYGTVYCRAELESVCPEVGVALTQDKGLCNVTSLICHPCVLVADASHSDGMAVRRIRFQPPNQKFTLCHYTCTVPENLPITARYSLKGEREASLEFDLQISKEMKNSFEYFEVQFIFTNRGTIRTYQADNQYGTLQTAANRKILIWNLGTRLPSRGSMTLKAQISFTDFINDPRQAEDPFCVANNVYAQLVFKQSDSNFSGATIDPKSVQLSTSTKLKPSVSRELLSYDFRVWNEHGDVPVAYKPPEALHF